MSLKRYHAAQAASLQYQNAGESHDQVNTHAMTAPPAHPRQVSATQISYCPVRAGQGKKARLDQKTRASIGLVRAVKVVRAEVNSPHMRARVCFECLSFYHLFLSNKENTLTNLTKSVTTGIFALTNRPDLP